MSEIRVTSVVGDNGGDPVGLTTGLTVGPLTGTTGIGATITHHGHAVFSGIVTASSFSGIDTDKISEGNTEVETVDTGSDGHVKITTEGTERLRIDSSGNVTKPNNFHILVDMSQDYTVQNASTVNTNLVKWDRVVTSQSSTGASSYFNTSTHLLTAPVSGLYYFDVAVNCDFNVEGAWLVINGSRANYSVFKPPSQNTSTGNVTYKLSASDTVGLKWYDAGNTNADFFTNDLHTWWRIILLG